MTTIDPSVKVLVLQSIYKTYYSVKQSEDRHTSIEKRLSLVPYGWVAWYPDSKQKSIMKRL